MDSSGFAGGNVEEYATWWPKVAVAAELGMWLLPNSSWERASRALNATLNESGLEEVFYPYPMPLQSQRARFNFNIMYLRELAEDDDSLLPRQYYRLPAHRHYADWPRRLQESCGNPAAQVALYERIRGEDWCAVRRAPQYLGRGWAQACVPEARKCVCCPVVSNPTDVLLAELAAAGVAALVLLVCGCGCLFCWCKRRRRAPRRVTPQRVSSMERSVVVEAAEVEAALPEHRVVPAPASGS